MPWPQTYAPLGSLLSTLLAALPVVVLLGGLAIFRWPAHLAALAGLAAALLMAIGPFGMPAPMALASAAYGAAYGLLPIGWIVVNVIFLYQLTNERGLFDVLRQSITHVTEDRRLQLLVVAFCFGAFFEGASGFGTPVAITGAILIGLGFSPLAASGLSLIANTAPVAFGALGHAGDRAAERHRARPAATERDGRASVAALLGDRAVLAGLCVCRLARHDRGVARDPGGGTGLCHPAVPGFQLPRPVAG